MTRKGELKQKHEFWNKFASIRSGRIVFCIAFQYGTQSTLSLYTSRDSKCQAKWKVIDARGAILDMSFIFLAAGSLFLSAIVFSVFLFIAKCNTLEELKKLPGPKPSVFFGNALQLRGEVHGKFICLYNAVVNVVHYPWLHGYIIHGHSYMKNRSFGSSIINCDYHMATD